MQQCIYDLLQKLDVGRNMKFCDPETVHRVKQCTNLFDGRMIKRNKNELGVHHCNSTLLTFALSECSYLVCIII